MFRGFAFLITTFVLTMALESYAAETELPLRFGLGQVPSKDEIKNWDIDISPDSKQLPLGQGSVEAGRELYDSQCLSCHGRKGLGGVNDQLVAPYDPANNFARDEKLKRTIGNYWPYATTLYDYINRAMPLTAPGSLESDEVYSLVAYLLYLNNIIKQDAVINDGNLAAIEMPARQLFYWSEEGIRANKP
jgi:S-disulfanyl-L-cysteine oxidoreductase SoxD